MSNRTWACIKCGKTYRRDQNEDHQVICSICRNPCEYVHWKIRVPSPKKKKEWLRFWDIYLKEKRQIDLWQNDQTIEEITLDLLNMKLIPRKRDA